MLLFSLVLAFCFFGSKGADVDPTTVCYPATLFAEYFNFITDDTGNVTFDFSQELMVQFSHKTGLRIVHDSKNLRTHSILTQGNTTTCRTSIIHPSAVVNQCLPAYAKRLTAANGHLGWNGIVRNSAYYGNSIVADTWEVVTEYDTVFRYTFRFLKTYYPVFTQELGSVGADVDPTTVCYPATLFADYFNLITDDTGNVTYDFNQELLVEFSDKTGLRIVHDFKNLRTHSILHQDNTTTCRTSIIHPSAVVNQCLPAYAKHLTDANGFLGYDRILASSSYYGYSILADTWEMVTEYDTVYRYIFRLFKSTYRPLFSQELGYGGTKNVYMYMNPTETISDKTVFELPDECEEDEEIIFPPVVG